MQRLLLVTLVAGLLSCPSVRAATIVVDTTTDELNTDGDCSLREAVKSANDDAASDACVQGDGADTIQLPAGTFTLTVTGIDEVNGATGDLNLYHDVSFSGAGAFLTVIDGNGSDRIVDAQGAIAVAFSNLALRNGDASGSSQPFGGAIKSGNADITLADCVLLDNDAVSGGAIFAALGSVTVTTSVFTGNDVTQSGGAIRVSEADLTVVDSTFAGNGAGDRGGAILTHGGASFVATVTGSTFSGNTATAGGAISNTNHCALTVRNSTISGNMATGSGGGLEQNFGDPVTLSNVTVAGNTGADGGGVMINSGTVTIRNSIVADNTGTNSGADCYGTLTTAGHNLVESLADCTFVAGTGDLTGVDPALAPLADNGGATQTRALVAGSPAIDAGDPATPGGAAPACEAGDQRGIARPIGAGCDMGAFEAPLPPTTTTTTVTTTTLPGASTTTSLPGATTTTTTLPPPLCAGGVTLTDASVRIGRYAAPSGDEKLTIEGTLVLPSTAGDPTTDGLQIRVTDTGQGEARLFDLTDDMAIPGGPAGAGCGTKDGWKKAKYKNRSGALGAPACGAGSALGLRTVKVKDKRDKGKGLRVTATAPVASVAAPTGPLEVTIVIGAGSAGACGTVRFDAAACGVKGKSYRCE